MVLHSFILNPRNYLADCIRYGKMQLWASGMPWKAIDAAIDNDTFAYRPSDKARKAFEAATASPWDNLHEPPCVKLKCPRCKSQLDVPWTTCDNLTQLQGNLSDLEQGRGYTDAGFAVNCRCSCRIDHEYLRCAKFVRDVQKVVTQNVPLPGGYLSLSGMVKSPGSKLLS